MKVRKMSFYAQVANRLNEKGVLPFSAREWNVPLVQRVIYGKSKDNEAIKAIQEIAKEFANDGIEIPRL
jgi:transposase